MVNLKIVRRNGCKQFNGKSYFDYTLLDERGYTFSLLSGTQAPDWLEYLPVMICSYKGQAKVRVYNDYLKSVIEANEKFD